MRRIVTKVLPILEKILKNIFQALYEPFGFAIILAILFMFFYLYSEERTPKQAIKDLVNRLKSDKNFRRVFLLAFYTALILFRTLLNRTLWLNPLSNVMGGWKITTDDTQAIENIILFVPFTFLLFLVRPPKSHPILAALKISFLFSFGIEFSQLLFHLGTLQLSDLCYNTLGGVIGGVGYWVMRNISRK